MIKLSDISNMEVATPFSQPLYISCIDKWFAVENFKREAKKRMTPFGQVYTGENEFNFDIVSYDNHRFFPNDIVGEKFNIKHGGVEYVRCIITNIDETVEGKKLIYSINGVFDVFVNTTESYRIDFMSENQMNKSISKKNNIESISDVEFKELFEKLL